MTGGHPLALEGAAAAGCLPVTVAGERLWLLPERAVYWPAAATLLVADLHWGKTETFHAHGIPIPAGTLSADLAALDRALARTGAARLVVLGDLIHAAAGLTPRLVQAVADWRAAHGERLALHLVRGNHDRHAPTLPPEWRIVDVGAAWHEGPFAFVHDPLAPATGTATATATAEPPPAAAAYRWGGHWHPMYWVRGRVDGVRLPCFHLGRDAAVLPAFSRFSGGCTMTRGPGDRVFVVADEAVIEWPA